MSFLATPAKVLARSPDLVPALEVGQRTSGLVQGIERVLLMFLPVSASLGRAPLWQRAAYADKLSGRSVSVFRKLIASPT